MSRLCCTVAIEGTEDAHCLPVRSRSVTSVGQRNYLVEGVSATGKTSVCDELVRRGYQAIHGDRELAYQGDPETGLPTRDDPSHFHHLWDVERVRSLVAEQGVPITFLCGGSRNFDRFLHLFDEVFVLEVDRTTLERRLDQRPAEEFGAAVPERELILRLHRTREDVPAEATPIDATRPLTTVVDDLLRRIGE